MHLGDLITQHFRLTDPHKSALSRLGIKTVRDLLFYFPFRYDMGGDESSISSLQSGQEVSLIGTLQKMEAKKGWKSRIPMTEGYLEDTTGKIKLRWFNQPYIAKMYPNGSLVKATGKVTGSGDKIYLANPKLERISATDVGLFRSSEPVINLSGPSADPLTSTGSATGSAEDHPSLFAMYPETRGVSSLWLRHAIQKVLNSGVLSEVEDPIPADLLKKYNLPTLRTSLVWVHTPKDIKDADAARKRFAFEEVFLIQLERQRERMQQAREKSFVIDPPPQDVDDFMRAFPFIATVAQKRAINAILKDFKVGHPMSRLLEGDVGSGKTAVAATAAFAVTRGSPPAGGFGTLQVAYMAPTEILAKQHFESFIKYFEATPEGKNFKSPINIGLITGSGCFKFPSKVRRDQATNISRAQLLKWVANGEIPVVIGTHALIEKSVQFEHLALVIIDEQHRFGISQRRKLAQKSSQISRDESRLCLPHLLSMTATPIPRTLALTIYGDLDLTLLDEMPPGRKPIITEIVKPEQRGEAYQLMRRQLKEGRQAYVICPRIDEPDPEKAFALQAKSVISEAKRLKKEIFPEYEIDILHSKMKPKEKDHVMDRFSKHEVDILVATSVVEVGVNVPNATMIFIEGAERFGLSQLHQLRGRVVRSTHQAYCFVCPATRGEKTMDRLKALTKAKNGFELAEMDLMQRGPGELSGRQQWGISDIGMEALKNLKLVEAARNEALELIKKDEHLTKHPLLQHALFARAQTSHFE
jgi:ATP-dependent DNA helicase RecG